VRLSDGRIVIANAGVELRFYDAQGRHQRTVGRKGRGPGEFQRIDHLLRTAGDTLMVWDAGLGPVSIFAPSGDLVRTRRIDPDLVMRTIGYTRATEALTPLPDGSFILHVQQRADPHEVGVPEGVIVRSPIGMFKFAPDLSRVDSLGWWDGGLPQMYLKIGGQAVYKTVPVTTHIRLGVGGDPLRIVVGNGDPYELRVFTLDGRLERVIRNLIPATPIPSEELDRIAQQHDDYCRQQAGGTFASHCADMRRVRDAMPRQTHYPPFNGFTVDSEGSLWVRAPGRGIDIFDPSGAWLGTRSVPGLILDIGRDYVLTIASDSLGVQRVKLYDVQRN
jgi:hypothetical protein